MKKLNLATVCLILISTATFVVAKTINYKIEEQYNCCHVNDSLKQAIYIKDSINTVLIDNNSYWKERCFKAEAYKEEHMIYSKKMCLQKAKGLQPRRP